ncbi:MAG: hypothetical protein EOP49_47840, partial [Sphingobacteriales bacterium]
GTDDWDDIPTSLEYEKESPALSDVRIVPTTGAAAPSGSSKPSADQKPKTKMDKAPHMDAVNVAAKSMQSDAPACNTCGHITIRSGTCYKCLNCGNSMGCS